MVLKRGFASDNNAGIHPEILNAIIKANEGHVVAYGDDLFTERAINKFKENFGKEIDVYFVFNGTAANVLGLTAITQSFNSIICAESSHLNMHECGAPEKFTDCKLITISTTDGKLTVEQIKKYAVGVGDPHHSQPKVISITQATEYGTLYTLKEIKEIADFAHSNNMLLHVDGARFCNAAAALGISLKGLSANIDVLSFGGTKNGMAYGEAVIFFNSELTKGFQYIRKQGMQLASKMRFIAAQFEAILSNELWLKNAKHANEMAKLLAKEIEKIPKIKISQRVETNSVFALMPKQYVSEIQKKYFFYVFNEYENESEARLMTAWDTTKDDIEEFVRVLNDIIK